MPFLEIKAPYRYIEVRRPDGTLVSRHLTIEDAIESAANAPPGITYDIIPPRRTVKVYGSLPLPGGDTQAPTVPGNPTFVSKGATTITFSWSASTDNVGVDGYQVFRNGSPIATTSQTSYTDSGLTPSTQYTYAVAAYDAAGNNSGTTGQTPLVVTTNANAAPAWSVGTQALTTNTSYTLNLTDVCSDADSNPITFSVLSGTLPTGVTFNSVAKTVSGTPTVVQTQIVTFRASDGIVNTDQAITFEVLNADSTAPPVPTMNAVSNIGSSTATCSWGAVTDPTVADARTSGSVVYTLQRATDSGFTTGVVTEVAQSGLSANLTGLSGSTQYWFRVKARDAALNESAYSSSVTATTQSGGYVATHYVAPFASVSGATNDYTDLGASAYAAAASSGAPTTLGTAMANAVAGNKVRCSPGIYTGVVSTQRFQAVFRPTNSGTAGNPIIFFAQYPAAYNYGSTSLYSELRHNGVLYTTRAAIGASGKNYIVIDGFYARSSLAFPAPAEGVFCFAGSDNCEFRRIVCDHDASPAGLNDYNATAIFWEDCDNCKVLDSRFVGNPTTSRQESHFMSYGCFDGLLEHNQFDCIVGGFGSYFKGTGSTGLDNTRMIARYNKYSEGGLAVANATDCEVYQNLLTGAPTVAMQYESSGTGYNGTKFYNNTMSISGANARAGQARPVQRTVGGMEWRNNIVVAPAGTQNRHFDGGQLFANEIQQWSTLDNNVYYASGSSPRFSIPTGTSVGLTAWQAALLGAGCGVNSRETNSVTTDPLFVGGTDYRLQGGSPASGRGCYITGSEEIGLRANPTY